MKILCATDFSDAAAAAVAEAVRVAQRLGAELVFVHVAVERPLYGETLLSMPDVGTVYEAQRRWATDVLEARAAAVGAQGVPARYRLEAGSPPETVARVALDEKADMIVVGTHGRSGLPRMLLGSVAERIIRSAPCPVLSVRPRD